MPFIDNDGVRIHWSEQGTGTPVLLVMGHRFSGRLWYPVVPALAARHRVVWFDNRGTGKSDSTRDASMADLVADAKAVLDAAGIDQAHVFGVSMGGVIAQELALTLPERVLSLVLGCTTIGSADVAAARSTSRLRYLRYYVPFRLYKNKMRLPLYGPAAPKDAVDRDVEMLATDPWTRRGVIAQSKAMEGYVTTHERVATLALPTLVLHGDVDLTVPHALGENLAATIPGARLETFVGAGHNFIVTDTERTNRLLGEFFGEVDAGAAGPARVPGQAAGPGLVGQVAADA